jgi:hypothetical protein
MASFAKPETRAAISSLCGAGEAHGWFFKGGKTLTLPDKDDGFKLEVDAPFGKEEIIVYASGAPLGEVAVENDGENLPLIVDDLENVGEQTRGVKIKKAAGEKTEAEFYEARHRILTAKRRQ